MLARPAKLNALDVKMFEALAGTGSALAERVDIRAVVLTGEGRAFCAGIDLDDSAPAHLKPITRRHEARSSGILRVSPSTSCRRLFL
jgi:enoyl-CoA hydratase/carnithine racemase